MLKPLNEDLFEILLQYMAVGLVGLILLTIFIVATVYAWTQIIYPSLYFIRHPSEAQEYTEDDECATNKSEEDDHGDNVS